MNASYDVCIVLPLFNSLGFTVVANMYHCLRRDSANLKLNASIKSDPQDMAINAVTKAHMVHCKTQQVLQTFDLGRVLQKTLL